MQVLRFASGLVLFTLLGSVALAHDTWLITDRIDVPANAKINIALTSGMKFPALEFGPKPERIAKAGFRLGAQNGELKEFTAGNEALRIETSFEKEGVATIWLQLLPKELELTDDKVAEYLDEIRATDEVRSAWARRKAGEKWKEEYTKCAKTCLAVGKAEDDRSWSEPVGLALEIVPVTNPTALKAGESAIIRLLRNGEPAANVAIALVQDGSDERVFQTTDANGVATFTIPKPGKYLLATTLLRPGKESGSWRSVFSTFTLQVH